jgi:hypothetical protein
VVNYSATTNAWDVTARENMTSCGWRLRGSVKRVSDFGVVGDSRAGW